jgi:hypothetical protein
MLWINATGGRTCGFFSGYSQTLFSPNVLFHSRLATSPHKGKQSIRFFLRDLVLPVAIKGVLPVSSKNRLKMRENEHFNHFYGISLHSALFWIDRESRA